MRVGELDLPAGSRLAGSETRVARGLLFGRECRLPLRLLGSFADEFGCGLRLCGLGLNLALGLGGETRRVPLGRSQVTRLDDGAPCRLSCK